MPEYAFDVKLWCCVRIQAKTEKEAREKLRDCECVALNYDDGQMKITEGCSEGVYDLLEIDGEIPDEEAE